MLVAQIIGGAVPAFNVRSRRFLSSPVMVLGVLATVSATKAQQIDVCVNFGGSGIVGAAAQTAFLAKVNAHFNGAIAVLANVNFVNSATTPPANCELRAFFINDATQRWHGFGPKNLAGCLVNRAFIDAKFPGAANAARRCAAYAETMAHEVGHLLCAVHRAEGAGTCDALGTIPCAGAPTLMSCGRCVNCANRGAGTRSLALRSQLQIRWGILRYFLPGALGGPPWSLRANFDVGAIGLVQGVSHLEIIPGPGEDFIAEDPEITISFTTTGDPNLFEWGWLAEDGHFVEPLPEFLPADDPDFPGEPLNPDRLLSAMGGTPMIFAIRGQEGTPLAGQVFNHIINATVTFGGVQLPAASAEVPPLTSDYFAQVNIAFNVGGNPFTIQLDAGTWGPDNGFYMLDNIPATGACCIGQALCVDQYTAEECTNSAGVHQGIGTTCGPSQCFDILSSDPPSGAIDARQPHPIDNPATPQGIASIVLTFSGSTSGLGLGDFSITEDPPSASPPLITNLTANGNTAEIVLDRPITPRAFTVFTYNPSGTCTTIGFLPGDVNADLTSGPSDILALKDHLSGAVPLPDYSTDIDRSGDTCTVDILRVIDLLNGAGAFDPWIDSTVAPSPCN